MADQCEMIIGYLVPHRCDHPALGRCTSQVGSRVVPAKFVLEETRRAVGIEVGGAGRDCMVAALSSLRTTVAPDVGDATVALTIAFDNGS